MKLYAKILNTSFIEQCLNKGNDLYVVLERQPLYLVFFISTQSVYALEPSCFGVSHLAKSKCKTFTYTGVDLS